MQQILNETATGYYLNLNNFQCHAVGPSTGYTGVELTAGSAEQGTNEDCIVLGRVIQFDVDRSPESNDPEGFNIYTVAGLRAVNNKGDLPCYDKTVTCTISLAKPKVIAEITSGDPDNSETKFLKNGLTTSAMYYNNTPANKIGAVALITKLNRNGTAPTGSQELFVVPIRDGSGATELNAKKAEMATLINNQLNDPSVMVDPPGGVQVCFRSGTTNDQFVLLTIGGGNRGVSVNTEVKNTADCQ
jgi:hypothetical protein